MKDIDKLQKRNRTYRDFTERLGSTGLAVSGLIGLLFLGVLVWQIAEPYSSVAKKEKFLRQASPYPLLTIF